MSDFKLPTCLALTLVATCASAQTVPLPSKVTATGPTVELSPFVISDDSEKGYVATSSLAGSRLKTDLKDIAAQIDIMTAEFLNDIAAVNTDEAVLYSTNNGAPNEQSTGSNDGSSSTRSGGRARGFDAITQSSDFYETWMPNDLYNVERLTIANGPQSILFGLGNAGGAIDLSTKRALMRNRYEVAFRTDAEGTLRTTFDANQQIVPKVLALRVVGLKSNVNSTLEGAFNDQQRLFGAATWRAAKNTTVRVSAERVYQKAAVADSYFAQDFLSPWVYAGRPLFDNSTGNTGVPATGSPVYARNTNALRVLAYDNNGMISTLPWNGSARSIGPNEIPNRVDTRKNSITDYSIYPYDRSPRVNGRLNRLNGQVVRGAVEQRITDNFFVELGFNSERVHELRGGPFFEAESIDIYADPNRYLPGGTAARPVTTLNPNAGKMYIETFPNGMEQVNETNELRLTTSYEFDFAKNFQSSRVLRWFGKHRLAGLISRREDEERTQASRMSIHGDTSFTTGDLSNTSRTPRTRYYLDPASGNYSAGTYPGTDSAFGPWSFKDTTTGETFTTSLFGNPAGRTSAVGGSKKEINTYMLALQSFFWNNRINVFGGRRVDDFKSYLIDPSALIRQDYLAPNDRRGLFRPLARTGFDSTPAIDKRGKTYSYGVVVHPLPWISLFGSKAENTALPPGFLDPDNRQIPGIYSDGYDYGFRLSLKQDAISLRVNFYHEEQHALIGDGQAVRTAAATIENRLRGPDRPAGIATVAADGYDTVTRGDVYRSVEDKIAHGKDITLTARLTSNWDIRVAAGQQVTHVFNKSKEFNAWVARRLPVWQQFGGLGWQNVTISASDPRTVAQFYDSDILREVLRSELRNDLPRFRQREWRANAFTNYRVSEGMLKGLNVGGGVRWFGPAVAGYLQKPFPTAADPAGTVDDVNNVIWGPETMFVDFLAGYGGRTKIFGGKTISWRVQLNIRNLFEPDTREPIRTRNDGKVLQYARVEPRQIIFNTTFTF